MRSLSVSSHHACDTVTLRVSFRSERAVRRDNRTRRNAFGVEIIFIFLPRVSPSSQPWALGRNPVGIDRRQRRDVQSFSARRLRCVRVQTF